MADRSEDVGNEESKDGSVERRNKMHKCYKYMSNLKKLLSKSEYTQFLMFLRMSRDNYMSEKIAFYATIAFQIFFPTDMKDLLKDYGVRKSLFAQSKYFFSKTDREAYSAACLGLTRKVDAQASAYLQAQSPRPLNDAQGKTKPSELTEWQEKPLPEQMKDINSLLEDERKESYKNQESSESEEQKRPSPEKSSLICMICFEDYEEGNKFAKAKCGHVACWNCWNQWLFNCLECPMCKQRTRVKQLISIP
eukprot:TRINITY_DN2728_c0_g1_i2.p1 TRINITY_DN2728_c0_g1~~TRINITY_DN2728_c0_g1_i2.p1  ORF type:complete len:250 (+),score=83.16 TRINITY_DN2728_c0_g1_i2:707-1456(+)